MKEKPLTVTLHIGGKQVDTLTADQSKRMADKITEAMSLYYTSNPAEFGKLQERTNQ